MKRFVILIICFISLLNWGCKSKKYILEVPYTFNYHEEKIIKTLNINWKKSRDSTAYEYEANLSDREIYLKEKFSNILKTSPENIINYKFYDFIDKKLSKHYLSHPDTLGISMAYFVRDLYNYSYKIKLPSTALKIFKSSEVELFLERSYLRGGDLIFFRYNKNSPISDVALYLGNDKIVTNSRDKGLIITSFSTNNNYFINRYIACGRVKQNKND